MTEESNSPHEPRALEHPTAKPAGCRMTPTFLIIGAMKAGTTSLHEYLGQHPDIGMPALKEIHYFSLHGYRPLSWYRAHFPPAGRYLHVGEATPYYLFHPRCPEAVRAALPNVKLIVVLRDPVERTYSHYNHARVLGLEHLDLVSALENEPSRLAGESERLRIDPHAYSFNHHHRAYLTRSRYAQQLERWYRYFPRDRLMVIPSEDLFEHPAATLRRLQGWLGVAEHTPPDLTPRNGRRYARLDRGLAAELRARLAPDVARLTELTDLQVAWAQ